MSETIKVDYPVYGAQFYDNNTAIITGGGGEGNNGIPNKISVLSIDLSRSNDKIKIINELPIDGKNDSPTGLALAKDILLIGANESSESIKNGENKHLRKYKFNADADAEKSPLAFVKAVDTESSKSSDDYQKLTAIAGNGSIAAIVSSKVPSVLRIINPETLEVKESIELEEGQEINDVAINAKGTKIAYITDKKLVLIQDGELPTLSHDKFSRNYVLSKVKFTRDEDLLIGVNLKNGAGVLLLHSGIIQNEETGLDILKTKKARVLSDKFKKITALDISPDPDQFIAVAGNDNSIIISDFQEFARYKTLKKVHSFAITKLSFSPNGEYLLSTSAANTVSVFKIPANIRFSYTPYIAGFIVLLLSYLIYYAQANITEEQWDSFQSTLAYLYGEDYTPLAERKASLSASIEAEVTGSVADAAGLTISETDEAIDTATSSFESTYTETSVEYETETIIKEGDIVDIRINTIVKREDDVTVDEPVKKVVDFIPEEELAEEENTDDQEQKVEDASEEESTEAQEQKVDDAPARKVVDSISEEELKEESE